MIDAHTYACILTHTYSHAVLTSHPIKCRSHFSPNQTPFSPLTESSHNHSCCSPTLRRCQMFGHTYACMHAPTHMSSSPLTQTHAVPTFNSPQLLLIDVATLQVVQMLGDYSHAILTSHPILNQSQQLLLIDVATLQVGQMFGELGVLHDRPRSCFVHAAAPTKVSSVYALVTFIAFSFASLPKQCVRSCGVHLRLLHSPQKNSQSTSLTALQSIQLGASRVVGGGATTRATRVRRVDAR
jgi:hypothetical protein